MYIIKKYIKIAYRYYENNLFLKWILIPFIIWGPSCLFSLSRYNKGVSDLITSHPNLTLVIAFFPLLIYPGKIISIKMRSYIPISQKHLMTLIECIDRVVASKSGRFEDMVGVLNNGNGYTKCAQNNNLICGRSIFMDITKPEDQVKLLVEAVWQYFELSKSRPEISIKVALAEMDEKYIKRFFCFYPSDKGPRSDVAELQKLKCGFSVAKNKKEIIIVESTRKEGKKNDFHQNKCFVQTSRTPIDEDGSMLCFPIYDARNRDVPYVISVSSNEPSYFKKAERDKYLFVLEKFSKRIALENGLKSIREKI